MDTYNVISNIPKITNGSAIHIGKGKRDVTVFTDQHFNWFQKKMMKWCFGFEVFDYTEE